MSISLDIEANLDVPAPPDLRVGQAYLLFAISLCLAIVVGFPLLLYSFSIQLAIYETLLVLLPALVFARLKRVPLAEALGWRPISPALALVSFVLGVSGIEIATQIRIQQFPFLGEGPFTHSDHPTSIEGLLLAMFCWAPWLVFVRRPFFAARFRERSAGWGHTRPSC